MMKAPLLQPTTPPKRPLYHKLLTVFLIATACVGLWLMLSSEVVEEEIAVGKPSDNFTSRLQDFAEPLDDDEAGLGGLIDADDMPLAEVGERTDYFEEPTAGDIPAHCIGDLKARRIPFLGWGEVDWVGARIITMPLGPLGPFKIEFMEGADKVCAVEVPASSCNQRKSNPDTTKCTGKLLKNQKSSGCTFKSGKFEISVKLDALKDCKNAIPYPFYNKNTDLLPGTIADPCGIGGKFCYKPDQVCRMKKNWVGRKGTCRGAHTVCRPLKKTNDLSCVGNHRWSTYKTKDCIAHPNRYCDEDQAYFWSEMYSKIYGPDDSIGDAEGTDRFFSNMGLWGFEDLNTKLSNSEKDYLYCGMMLYPRKMANHLYKKCYGISGGTGYGPYATWKQTQRWTLQNVRDAWKRVFVGTGGLLELMKKQKFNQVFLQDQLYRKADGNCAKSKKVFTVKDLTQIKTFDALYEQPIKGGPPVYDCTPSSRNPYGMEPFKQYYHFYRSRDSKGGSTVIRLSWGYTNQATMFQAYQAISDVFKAMSQNGKTSNVCYFKFSPFNVLKADHVILSLCPYYESQEQINSRTEIQKGKNDNPMVHTKDQVKKDIGFICDILKAYDDRGLMSHHLGAFQTEVENCPYITFTTYWGSSSGINLAAAVTSFKSGYESELRAQSYVPTIYSGWNSGNKEEKVATEMALFTGAWQYCNQPSAHLKWDWKNPESKHSFSCAYAYQRDGPESFVKVCFKEFLATQSRATKFELPSE